MAWTLSLLERVWLKALQGGSPMAFEAERISNRRNLPDRGRTKN
jgi:hypothetical protein